MKVELHVPVEQYGFVAIEANVDYTKSHEIREIYDAIKAAFKEKPESTLPEKEMVDFLYAQIHSLGNHVETWESMNPAQKTFINQLKKALARKKPEKANLDAAENNEHGLRH